MTQKTTKSAKTAASKTDEKVMDRVTEGAREMIKRSTSTAKERADSAYDATKKYNAELENLLVRGAKGYTNILGNIVDAAFVNVNRGIDAAEKLAKAESLSDAMKIQTAYVREQSECSMNNARAAVEYIREVAVEGGENVRETATKMFRSDKAA